MNTPKHHLLRILLSAFLGAHASSTLAQTAENEPDEAFADQESVTAVDVMVSFEHGKIKKWSSGRRTPKKLSPDDFEVLYGGRARRVIAAETEDEPWTLVVYFDSSTTEGFGMSWAADLLTQHSAELTQLGLVEIVVADPLPHVVLEATNDADAVVGALSQIALPLSQLSNLPPPTKSAGQPGILDVRAEFLAEALHPTPAVDPQEFARWMVREEVRMVQQGQDALLRFLVDHRAASTRAVASAKAAASTTRRAVLLVSSGYDLQPGLFYLPTVGLGGETLSGTTAHLEQHTQDLGKTLGAYGWVVVPIQPPPPTPEIRPGKRVGKWRLQPFGAVREGERDLGKAEAYLELAEAQRDQGRLEDAEGHFKKALHHFFGDPRTADRQAFILLELGAVQRQLGKEELAKNSLAEARVLDPAQATSRLGPEVRLMAAGAPLKLLATITAGAVVTQLKELARTTENLAGRIRLTYQVPGLATGELYPVRVTHREDDRALQAPGWARSATPTTVAAARVRGMLSGRGGEGDLQVRVRLDPALERSGNGSPRRGNMTVVLAEDSTFAAGEEILLRLTVAAGAPDELARVWHELPQTLATDELRSWFHQTELTLNPEDSLLVVTVEDLFSGHSGTKVISVRDPDRDENEFP